MKWSHDAFLPVLLLACLQYTRVFSPAWSLFHGWEHRKSSSDGRDPSSDWTGSGRREPSHSATSPDAPARDSERRPDPRTSCSCTASPEEPTVKYYNHVLKSTLVLRNIIPQLNYEAQWGYVCYLFEKISEKFALKRNDSIWLQKHTNKGKKPRGLKIFGLVTWLPRRLICHTFSLLWAAYTHALSEHHLYLLKHPLTKIHLRTSSCIWKPLQIGPFGILFSARPEGYTECTEASVSQITSLSRMLIKRNLWRGAIPTPAWLGPTESLCSRASKRWKPLWAGQKRQKVSATAKQYESKLPSRLCYVLQQRVPADSDHNLYWTVRWT